MDGTIVTLRTFREYQKAYFLKNQLDAEGIESYLSYESLPGKTKESRHDGIKLRVKDVDVEKAIAIMFSIREEYGKDDMPAREKLRAYRKIMVPVDFSTRSLEACQFAIGLAKNLHGEIRLIHVYEDPLDRTDRVKETASFEKYREEISVFYEKQARKDMEAFTAHMREQIHPEELTSARFHYQLSHGDFASEVIREAEEYRPELIVLGTSGQHHNHRDISEQTGLEIIRNSRFPLLVVPEGARYEPVDKLKVLYATDFLDGDFSAFRQLLAILSPFRIHLYCVHVETTENDSLSKSKMDELNAQIADQYSHYQVEFHLIRHEDIIDGIHAYAGEIQAHMISFTSPRRSMIYKLLNPDNLKRVISESRIPLLVFRTGREL